MKRKRRLVLVITIFIYCFSVFSVPKKAEAIGGEIALWLGGSALTGTSIGAIGTAIGVLGVAGLAVVAGTGLYYLGKDLYDHWYGDQVLNSDGSVTVNDEMLDSTQNFIDAYTGTGRSAKDASLSFTPTFVPNITTKNNGVITTLPFNAIPMGSYVMKSSYDGTVPVNKSIYVTVGSSIFVTVDYVLAIDGQVTKISDNINIGGSFSVGDVAEVRYVNARTFLGSGSVSGYKIMFDYQIYNDGVYSHTLSTGHLLPKYNTAKGKSVSVGVANRSDYPVAGKPYDTGSISLDAPVLNNTGSISAQRVVDTYGRDAIISVPKEWVYDVPLNPSIPIDAGIVIPGVQEGIRDVAQPITYPVEENPSIPGDIPYVPDLTLPGSVSLDFSPLYINLTDKFPFSLPWDMSNLFHSFRAPAVAPKFNVKFDEQYFLGGGEFDIDFNRFSKIASILKFFVLISFVIMLIKLTRNMIGG